MKHLEALVTANAQSIAGNRPRWSPAVFLQTCFVIIPSLSIENLCVPMWYLKRLYFVAVSPARVGPGHGHIICLGGRACGSNLVTGDGG